MLRPLGIFERALFISDRHAPFNVVGVLRLENPPDARFLHFSLELLQERHPFLRARIIIAAGRPYFETITDARVPMIVAIRSNSDRWMEIVEEEMDKPLDVLSGPLFRVIYLYEDDMADLIVTFHHSIMDAASGINLLGELLQLCVALEADEQTKLPALSVVPAADTRFPASYPAARRILPLISYIVSQMGEEMTYRWRSRGKRIPKVHTGGHGHIATLSLPESLVDSLAQRARKEKVTLNSLLNAALLLAVNRHLYDGAPLPMQTFTFADLRPYTVPSTSQEHLANYITMMRFTLDVEGNQNIWGLTRQLHAKIYAAFRRGHKFMASLVSEQLIKMLFRAGTMRMAASALNYTGAVPLEASFGNIRVMGLHTFNSALAIGPELAGQARLFKGQLWMDFTYRDTDMDRALAEKIVGAIGSILENAAAGSA